MLHVATVNVNIRLASLKAKLKPVFYLVVVSIGLICVYATLTSSRPGRFQNMYLVTSQGVQISISFQMAQLWGKNENKKRKEENTSVALRCPVNFSAAGGPSKV